MTSVSSSSYLGSCPLCLADGRLSVELALSEPGVVLDPGRPARAAEGVCAGEASQRLSPHSRHPIRARRALLFCRLRPKEGVPASSTDCEHIRPARNTLTERPPQEETVRLLLQGPARSLLSMLGRSKA